MVIHTGLRTSDVSCYAAYTCSNHENRVAEQLSARRVEHFLPLYQSVRRWKDRRVQLELPLFPGYLKHNSRVAISIDLIQRSIVVEAEKADLEPAGP